MLLTYDFPPATGGVQRYLYELCHRLPATWRVTAITPVAGTTAGVARLVPAGRHAGAFWRTARRVRPACVLVGHVHPQLLLAAALLRRPYIAFAHGNDYLATQRRWHAPLTNRLLRRARLVVTHSHANRQRLAALGIQHVKVIYPGTDPLPPRAPASGPPVLLTVGRLVPRKGVDTVLQALPMLRAHYPDLTYQIAGEGSDRPRLQQLAVDLGLAAHAAASPVEFLGRLDSVALEAAYRRAHLFVMPVREEIAAASIEGFGIVFLEAAAAGLPTVAGRSGGAPEAISDGVTGFLVDPHDPADVARRIDQLLADPALRAQMGAAGRNWVATTMNWARAGREFSAALADACAAPLDAREAQP